MTRAFGNKVGVRLIDLSTREHIDFIQCTFARADTWALWQDGFPEDRPIESLRDVLALGFRGMCAWRTMRRRWCAVCWSGSLR